MAEQQSEKNCYRSRYGGGWVDSVQILAEIMVARKARYQGKELPPRFWTNPVWNREFKLQARMAKALLDLYSVRTIFNAIRRAPKIYSFHCKMVLDPILQEEQEKLERQQTTIEAKPPETTTPSAIEEAKPPRSVYNPSQSQLAKLRSLDG